MLLHAPETGFFESLETYVGRTPWMPLSRPGFWRQRWLIESGPEAEEPEPGAAVVLHAGFVTVKRNECPVQSSRNSISSTTQRPVPSTCRSTPRGTSAGTGH